MTRKLSVSLAVFDGIAADKLETVLKVLLRVQLRLIENMAVQD
jgi:hypothetical protein